MQRCDTLADRHSSLADTQDAVAPHSCQTSDMNRTATTPLLTHQPQWRSNEQRCHSSVNIICRRPPIYTHFTLHCAIWALSLTFGILNRITCYSCHGVCSHQRWFFHAFLFFS